MPDALAENFTVLQPDGTVKFDFAGHLKATGLDLNAPTNAGVTIDDQIRWIRASDGAMVAALSGYTNVVGGSFELNLQAGNGGGGGRISLTPGSLNYDLADSAGGSDFFIKGTPQFAISTGNINFDGRLGGTTNIQTVTVNLGMFAASARVLCYVDPGRFVNNSGANQNPVGRIFMDNTAQGAGGVELPVPDTFLIPTGTTQTLNPFWTVVSGISTTTHTFTWREINGAGDGSGSTFFQGASRPITFVVIPI